MRTRNQAKLQSHPSGNGDAAEALNDESVSLADISREAVGKLVRRANRRCSSGNKKQDSYFQHRESTDLSGSKRNEIQDTGGRVTWNTLDSEGCSRNAIGRSRLEHEIGGESSQHTFSNSREEIDESDWEDGSIPSLNSVDNHQNAGIREVTVELSGLVDSCRQKTNRRASAEDKELAELIHKVHLLCLLARGRLIDRACSDPLIQASLLSLLPADFLKISEVPKLTADALNPLVSWFHNNFRVRSQSNVDRPFHSALAFALEAHEGTPEEVAALSVALFRALNLATRFVSILDVASLKPGTDKFESSQNESIANRGIFDTSTLMVARTSEVSISPVKPSPCNVEGNVHETSLKDACKNKVLKSRIKTAQSKDSPLSGESNDRMLDCLACQEKNAVSEACVTGKPEGSKRKGDLEFDMQLEMALSATAVGINESNKGPDEKEICNKSSNFASPLKGMKRIKIEGYQSSSQGISTAVGSRKVGAPLYWAEVFCNGENLTGKWVHVDAVNAIIDGEQKVEAAAAACKASLRYVVAFSGLGAKDVTRRYCMKWYRIASQRINSAWWDAVMAPLKELEAAAAAAGDNVRFPGKLGEVAKENGKKVHAETSVRNTFVATRNSLEDMELETRALTEPLPTNQQAYRNHQLYAIERWLTKYQTLHPKGPVLGFCSGHPVYPRTCVRTLKTKERWLREGLQVKADEHPAKVLKRSLKLSKAQALEGDDYGNAEPEGTIALYGRWQMEPLCLPCAVNGIVPKNERGRVDVWSEKCLPPGTVHLRLPRVVPIAKKLEIDFAPAMVGFEFRNGRSVPVFDGIVVCAEFKDVILEVYADEEERRQAAEKRAIETQAISRWYQLLSSIVTRQRLNKCYGNGMSYGNSMDVNNKLTSKVMGGGNEGQSFECQQRSIENTELDRPFMVVGEEHEHVFLADDQSFDEERLVRTKRCHCGFSVQVEEL